MWLFYVLFMVRLQCLALYGVMYSEVLPVVIYARLVCMFVKCVVFPFLMCDCIDQHQFDIIYCILKCFMYVWMPFPMRLPV